MITNENFDAKNILPLPFLIPRACCERNFILGVIPIDKVSPGKDNKRRLVYSNQQKKPALRHFNNLKTQLL